MISVIVPVFNNKDTVTRCVNSIINQSYDDIEIIIIDDGSKDGSGTICDGMAAKDGRIKVVHTINGGLVAARKNGIKLAKGEYIGFVDADDVIEPTFFHKLFVALKDSGADFVHSGFVRIKDGYCQPAASFDEGLYLLDTERKRIDFLRRFYLDIKGGSALTYSIWSKLYKREFIEKEYGALQKGQDIGEDALCLCKCILDASSVYLLPTTLYKYYMYGDSLSRRNFERVVTENVHRCSDIISLIESSGYAECLRHEMADFSISFLLQQIYHYMGYMNIIPKFYFKNIETLKGRRVVLYGAGEVGRAFYKQLICESGMSISGICDRNTDMEIGNMRVTDIKDIKPDSYDTILVCVESKVLADSIKESLMLEGIHEKEILWSEPGRYF